MRVPVHPCARRSASVHLSTRRCASIACWPSWSIPQPSSEEGAAGKTAAHAQIVSKTLETITMICHRASTL